MAHPKRKTSKTRRDKRRTHYKATEPTISICANTQTPHLSHRAYLVDNDLYYNGQKVVEGFKKAGKNI